jgi:hypothetical protein
VCTTLLPSSVRTRSVTSVARVLAVKSLAGIQWKPTVSLTLFTGLQNPEQAGIGRTLKQICGMPSETRVIFMLRSIIWQEEAATKHTIALVEICFKTDVILAREDRRNVVCN